MFFCVCNPWTKQSEYIAGRCIAWYLLHLHVIPLRYILSKHSHMFSNAHRTVLWFKLYSITIVLHYEWVTYYHASWISRAENVAFLNIILKRRQNKWKRENNTYLNWEARHLIALTLTLRRWGGQNWREMNKNVGAPWPGLGPWTSCLPSKDHPRLATTLSPSFMQYIVLM